MADDNMFDRILEMGMGFAVANQIPKMVGNIIPDNCGGQNTPPSIDKGLQLYAVINEIQSGPYSEQEIITLIQRKMMNENTLVWKQGLKTWVQASQIPEIGKLLILYLDAKQQ